MKGILFVEKRKVAVKDVPKPDCRPGTVLVKVEAAGICGSDLHTYEGQWGLPDHVVGHELAGRVVEVGEGVDGIAAGDCVCCECFTHCGQCANCRNGLYNLCAERQYGDGTGLMTGAFAEFARLPAGVVFPMPPAATVEQTVLVEPAAVASRAVSLSGARPGDFALVIGGGTIGLLCAAVLKARMRLRCMIVAKYDRQAEAARALGIDHVHKVTAGKTPDRVRALTGGRMADVAIDTIGSTLAIADAADSAKPGGTICVVGLAGGRTVMPVGAIVSKELRVVGSCCYAYSNGTRDFDAAIELLASGVLPPDKLITHQFPLDKAPEAFAAAADKSSASIKVIIRMPA